MNFATAILATLLAISSAAYSEENTDAVDILQHVDSVRVPGDTYFISAEVHNTGSRRDSSVFKLATQGDGKVLIETIKPTQNSGRRLLVVDEDTWAYIPSLKRAVRVSLKQTLTGDLSYGDLGVMRWSADYSPIIETATDTHWVLCLTAANSKAVYDRIRVWVDKSNYHPERAEFMTRGGTLIKKATFQNYREIAGRQRPGEVVFENASRAANKTRVVFLEMISREFSSAIFSKNTLAAAHLTDLEASTPKRQPTRKNR